MEVHFSSDIETRLAEVAASNGKNAEQLVKETVSRMLDNQASFVAGVQKGIERADRGELVDHEDVVNRIEGYLLREAYSLDYASVRSVCMAIERIRLARRAGLEVICS